MDSKQAAERVFMLRKAAKEMTEEADALARQFFAKREQDSYEEGPFKVVVGRNARFDAGLAKKILSEEEYNSILETKPSGTKAKDLLAPAVYRSLQKDAEYNKVTITLPED